MELWSFNSIAYADGLEELIFKVNDKILNPLIEITFVVALVIFLFGLMEFIRNPSNKDKREQGRSHMLWGVIGFLIMFTVFGIINLLVRTFGIQGVKIDSNEQTFNAPPIQTVKLPK